MFTRAIVRPPAQNFADGLTTAKLGSANYELALQQHEGYCRALEQCGLTLTRLEADPRFPDSCFVEDVAVLVPGFAILTRPGAPVRLGEIEGMRKPLAEFFSDIIEIDSPGTLDGGDVLETEDYLFIGLSARTNESGARQLAAHAARVDLKPALIDIRNIGSLLHLKSGITYLGDNRLVVTSALAQRQEFAGYDLVNVAEGEEYAANCVRVNDHVLIAAGHRQLSATVRDYGYEIIELDMSEFQKMDGGLSCLSLRF